MLIKANIRNAQCIVDKTKETNIKSTTGINHIENFFLSNLPQWGHFFVLRNGGRMVKEYGLISFLHTGHFFIYIPP